ncbi:MAG: ankyrin repeat domain-containing protein [Acidobacteriia bacterium]|nr:ankyrin repeat domain-containing protein [Terriglobia bacterium]
MRIRLKPGAALGLLLAALAAAAAVGDQRLVDAAKAQDTAAVRALLKQRANVNAAQGDGATALHWAAHWDDRATAELLIRAGANANAADDEGVTPLSLACLNGSAAMVEQLLKAGANPNLTQLNGETPLMTAAHTGNLDVLKMLLAHGADVNAREASRGQTALMRAVAENHADAVQLLVASKADARARSKTGFTPLLFAAQQGNLQSAEILLKAGADVNETAPDGIGGDTNARALFKPNTEAGALLVAIDSGHAAMAKFLVEHGAEVNQNGAGRTPLHSAVQQAMPELVKVLLDHKAHPNVKTTRPMPLLSRYIQAQTGVDVNPVGATPFWLAADFGDTRSMRALIAGGADPSIPTADQTTPLMAAAGVDFIEGQDRYGRRWFQDTTMPLQLAALEALKLCLELGGDLNAANANGLTAMHGAAYMGSNLIAQFLFDHGAKLNARNRLGQTPYFITQGVYQAGSFIIRKETGELLRKLGADTNISAEKGAEVNARQSGR